MVTRPYAKANVWPYLLTAEKEASLRPGNSFKECSQDCPEMIVVPAGAFAMGSSPSEKGHTDAEGPQHNVTIAKPFAVSKFELTFADWDACVVGGGCDNYKPNDQGWGRGQQPVVNISRDDVEQYVVWLSQVTGKTYRLLSESEIPVCDTSRNDDGLPVGRRHQAQRASDGELRRLRQSLGHEANGAGWFLPPNKFGLYDMVGNIYEWIEDCLHQNYSGAPVDGAAWMASCQAAGRQNVLRGGGWLTDAVNLRSSFRLFFPTDFATRMASAPASPGRLSHLEEGTLPVRYVMSAFRDGFGL